MLPVLMVLFLVVPLVELAVIVRVSGGIGLGNTIGLLVVVSVVGAWLVKREGTGVLRRVQVDLQRGRLPGRALVDGALIAFAGALMLTPGFLTDGLGLSLLLPPVRAVVRGVLARRFRGQIAHHAGFTAGPDPDGDVIDAEVIDDERDVGTGGPGRGRLDP